MDSNPIHRHVQDLMRNRNMGARRLEEAILTPEVRQALDAWTGGGVLIGGLALGLYSRPRSTMDVDLVFQSDAVIPTFVSGFRKTRPHGFVHLDTGVEVEALSPEFLKWPQGLMDLIGTRTREEQGKRVIDPVGLVATKLLRGNRRDLGDIEGLLEADPELILGDYRKFLSQDRAMLFYDIKNEVKTAGPRNSHDIPDPGI